MHTEREDHEQVNESDMREKEAREEKANGAEFEKGGNDRGDETDSKQKETNKGAEKGKGTEPDKGESDKGDGTGPDKEDSDKEDEIDSQVPKYKVVTFTFVIKEVDNIWCTGVIHNIVLLTRRHSSILCILLNLILKKPSLKMTLKSWFLHQMIGL